MYVQQGSTYFFNKVRLKVTQDQKYNNPKQESEYTTEHAEPFTEPLLVFKEISISKEITGNIIAINNINKYSSCCTSAKKVTITDKIAFCDTPPRWAAKVGYKTGFSKGMQSCWLFQSVK